MHRSAAMYVCTLAVGLALGIGAVAVAGENPTPPARASATDAQIIRELRNINRALGANYKRTSLTGITFNGFNDTKDAIDDVYGALADMCRALGGDSLACPSFSH